MTTREDLEGDMSFLHIDLGHGKYEIGPGVFQGLPAVAIGRGGDGVVGKQVTKSERTMAPEETVAVITFENAASVDVVMAALLDMRERRFPSPVDEPTGEMWGGLARDVMLGLDLGLNTPGTMRTHLKRLGREIPAWLEDEFSRTGGDSVMSKGTRVSIIYKAMRAAKPVKTEAEWMKVFAEVHPDDFEVLRAAGDGASSAGDAVAANIVWRMFLRAARAIEEKL